MKRSLLFILALPLLFIACKKDTTSTTTCTSTPTYVKVPDAQREAVRNYLTMNSITAVEDTSGFFYEILEPGTGKTPALCSNVLVRYIGSLTTGIIFDQNPTGTSFALSGLITGWQKGLPLIKTGGSIKLYIPPALGYGSTPTTTVPGNSILIFHIQLLDLN